MSKKPSTRKERARAAVMAGAPTALEVARYRRRAAEAIRQRDQAREELALERDRLELYEATSQNKVRPIKPKKANRRKREAAAVSVLSDWHVGEVVLPEEVEGVNEYNKVVCKQRAERYWEGLVYKIKAARQDTEVDELLLLICGDIVTGSIHEELQDTNDLTPSEQIVYAEDLIVGGLLFLLREIPDLQVTCVMDDGNHDRNSRRVRFKLAARNALSWILYQHIHRRFAAEPRVSTSISESIVTHVEVMGYVVRETHGHTIKGGGGVGGISVPILRRCGKWDRKTRADYTFMGHFHQCTLFSHVAVNGSLKGFDSYADGHGFNPEPPRQIFCLLDRDHGLRSWDPIWV